MELLKKLSCRGAICLAGVALLAASDVALNGQPKVDILRIGTSGPLTGAADKKEEGALETLKNFVKGETNLENDFLRQKDWREVADKMAKGQLQLGIFQGYEFAWAQEKYPDLKPLALAINVYPYPVAYVVVNKKNKAEDFAGLKGQSFALPATGQTYLDLFVEHQAGGKKPKDFFGKVTAPENIEDALDDVVDGPVQGTVVDRAAFDRFSARKPGRAAKLKIVAKSSSFPPPLVAYYGKTLDAATRDAFQKGLLGAHNKAKGGTLLNLFRLTKFEAIPGDFEKVLTKTRETYPAPK